jgi:coenzyme F420-reducing hydrogenase delta subunit
LDFVGFDTGRITFSWVSAAEGAKWAQIVNETVDKIRDLGPYTDYSNLNKLGVGTITEVLNARTA